jgi:hypothetical protein
MIFGSRPRPTRPAATISSSAWSYGLALVIGVGLVTWLIAPDRVFLAHPLLRGFEGDTAQSVIGQRYFLAEPWHWPVLLAHRLAWPAGTNVALTDSLPIALLPLKLFAAWLPPGFYVQEGYLAVALVLQPVAAVFALRGAGEYRMAPNVALAVLSLAMPMLVVRIGQMSLCTQALILCAIGLYFRLVARPRPTLWGEVSLWGAVPLLLLTALLTHPYLLAMSAGVITAVPATLLLRGDRRWLAAACWVGGSLAVAGGAMVLLGFGGTALPGGFGVYSMNLLAPFVPGESSLFHYRLPDATGGQVLEGDVYLGAGALLLAAVALVQAVRDRGHAVGRHFGLVLVLVGMVLFALSDRIYAGSHLLATVDWIPAPLRQFRATGRFFWPAGYVILILGVMAAMGLPRRAALLILLAAVTLQVADERQKFAKIHEAELWAPPWRLDTAALRPIFARSDLLTLWPTFECGAITDGDPRFMQMLQLASETQLRTNTMYVARSAAGVGCDADAVLGAPWRPHELRAILPPANTGERWLVPEGEQTCRVFDGMLLCAEHDPAILALAGIERPTIPLGQTVTPGSELFQAMLAEGWFKADHDGSWSIGPHAGLRFQLPPEVPPRITLTLHVIGIAPAAGQHQTVRLLVNGVPNVTWSLDDMVPATVQTTMPAAAAMTLELQIASPIRPADRGMNADQRSLGVMLQSLRMDGT